MDARRTRLESSERAGGLSPDRAQGRLLPRARRTDGSHRRRTDRRDRAGALGAGPEVLVGPGDDAAVVRPGAGELVLTTDAMVEGVHFLTDRTTPRDLGYKAIAVNVSDIAAMGAKPAVRALRAHAHRRDRRRRGSSSWPAGCGSAATSSRCRWSGGTSSRGGELSIVVTRDRRGRAGRGPCAGTARGPAIASS